MIYLSVLLYICYNIVVFRYSSLIFGIRKISMVNWIGIMIINTPLIILPIFITEFQHEYLVMCIYFATFLTNFLLTFKQGLFKSLFGLCCFALNFFAIRMLVITCMGFYLKMPVYQIFENMDNRIIITCINFFVPIPYILSTEKFVKPQMMDMFFTSKKNLVLSTSLLTAVFCNQVIHSILYYSHVRQGDYDIHWLLVKCALFTIILFIAVLIYAGTFAKLGIEAMKFDRISTEYNRENTVVEEMEAASKLDSSTGVYVRSVAEDKMSRYLAYKENFFIAFIDLDGLKTVNDAYGHNEGDFYIKEAANSIKKFFSDDIISRIGGDEFLVVGKYLDNYEPANKLRLAAQDIIDIEKRYYKEYSTSISYGLVVVDETNMLGMSELISKADKEMYHYKHKNNKSRTIKQL